MLRYFLHRLLLAGVTLLAILAASYAMLRLAPGDPARSMLFGGEASGMVSEKRSEMLQNNPLLADLHLDKSIGEGFLLWLKAVVLRGDFGMSVAVDPGRKVTSLILERLPVTLKLNLWAVFFTYLIAVMLGIYGAVYEGTWFDFASSAALFLLYSLPVIWVALLLQSMFCEGGMWPVFPLQSMAAETDLANDSSWKILWKNFAGYFLPVLCLTYGGLAGLSRYARNAMADSLHSHYILAARAKGAGEERIIFVHALRNSLIVLITLFSGLLPSLIAGSVLIEYIFSIPGMGTLSLLSLSSRDYPLQMALFTFAGALSLLGILMSDLLYMWADPRIKLHRS